MNELKFPLNIQMFSEDEGGNPTPETIESEVKTFTQEEVDNIVKKRLNSQTKSFYKSLGVSTEDEFNSLVERTKTYDDLQNQIKTLTEENNAFKKLESERTYKSQMANVDNEYIDIVYNLVKPTENEKAEDYKARVDSYLEQHPKLAKADSKVIGTISSNPNLNGVQGDSINIQLRKAMGLKV